MAIHPLAHVHPSAEIGCNVEIGPFCVVEEKVRIGDDTILHPHAMVLSNTILGSQCEIYPGAVLGGAPQDTKYAHEESYLIIGDRNIIREYVTIHRATGYKKATRLGNENMIMAYSHIGHNCIVGNHVMISNSVGVAGHVIIEDRVVVGGLTGIHQLVRVGKLAMVGGYSKVTQDVPPFTTVDGRPTKVYGLNVIGLRRNGFSAESRAELKRAYRLLYRSNLNISQAIERIEKEIPLSENLQYLLNFIRNMRNGRAGRQLDR